MCPSLSFSSHIYCTACCCRRSKYKLAVPSEGPIAAAAAHDDDDDDDDDDDTMMIRQFTFATLIFSLLQVVNRFSDGQFVAGKDTGIV